MRIIKQYSYSQNQFWGQRSSNRLSASVGVNKKFWSRNWRKCEGSWGTPWSGQSTNWICLTLLSTFPLILKISVLSIRPSSSSFSDSNSIVTLIHFFLMKKWAKFNSLTNFQSFRYSRTFLKKSKGQNFLARSDRAAPTHSTADWTFANNSKNRTSKLVKF